jgi:oligopeptide transport system ATP-binding protein
MTNTRIDQALLNVENLYVHFPIKAGLLGQAVGYIRAVDGISLAIQPGQTMGLVGESGCGKTTLAKSIIRLVPAKSGRVVFEGVDVLKANSAKLTQIRRQICLIFQDPFGSLNPRMSIGNVISEPLKVHKGMSGNRLHEQVAELLAKVGLSADYMNRYPHEFSGGQRQRIAMARALAAGPKMLICDEPVSALDTSVQAQVLNLLKDLQEEFGLTYLFIAHDLAVVEFFCDVVAVVYGGRIVEQADAKELCANPLHPYTRTLISAVPRVRPSRKRSTTLWRRIHNTGSMMGGCPFQPGCSLAEDYCLKNMPALKPEQGQDNHLVACWKY